MTVLQIIKDLISKEDVNWGDSSTTFSRETHTGGQVSVHYIDAECIPSTGLGGFVGDHLHVQNTDTGTSSNSFIIRSNGASATLNASTLGTSREFSFPDTGDQELVGGTDLGSVANGLGASLVGIEDSASLLTATDVEGALAEIAADVSDLSETGQGRGYLKGFKLSWLSTTSIQIGGGMVHHAGTAEQRLYMESTATFTLGSAGSNTGSTDLGANQVHYIYVDDSAVVSLGDNEITATEILNSTTAPAYSNAKVGWYNSNDRCIGAVLTNASNQVIAFRVLGDELYLYDEFTTEVSAALCGTTIAAGTVIDISSSVPAFCTRARVKVTNDNAAAVNYFFMATVDVSKDPEVFYGPATLSNTFDIALSSTQVTYYCGTAAVTTTVDTVGYFLDEL